MKREIIRVALFDVYPSDTIYRDDIDYNENTEKYFDIVYGDPDYIFDIRKPKKFKDYTLLDPGFEKIPGVRLTFQSRYTFNCEMLLITGIRATNYADNTQIDQILRSAMDENNSFCPVFVCLLGELAVYCERQRMKNENEIHPIALCYDILEIEEQDCLHSMIFTIESVGVDNKLLKRHNLFDFNVIGTILSYCSL